MLIFLDTETTGLEKEDKICSLGIIFLEDNEVNSKYELLNEGKKISPKASSVNHITNEMLHDKSSVIDGNIYTFLVENNNEHTTIIGHNINYNLQKLSEIGFNFKGLVIDTLRVAKHLIEECESYALQVLRYELKLYKKEILEATLCKVEGTVLSHHALYDALIIKLLYDYLLELVTQEEMYILSFKNVLLKKFEFGKYAGRYIEDIAMNDRGYLEWMSENIIDLDEDLRYSITYYLEGLS